MSAFDDRILEGALAEVFRGPGPDLETRVLEAWDRERTGRARGAPPGSIERRARLRLLAASAIAASVLAALLVWRFLLPGPLEGEVVVTAAGEISTFQSDGSGPRRAREVRAGELLASFPSAAAPAIAWGGDGIRCRPATLLRFDTPGGSARASVLLGTARVDHAAGSDRSVATDHAVARLRDGAVVVVRVLPPFEGDDDMFTQEVRRQIRGSLAAGAVTTIAVLQGSVLVEARGASRTVGAGATLAVDVSGFQDTALATAGPGPEHELLKRLVGSWKSKTRFRATPDGPWQEMTGAEEREMGCGGLWLFSRTRSEFGFDGRQQLGYDRAKKKFVATWVDSESSTMSSWEGTYDETTKVLTLFSEFLESSTRKPTRMRMTYDLSVADSMLCRLYRGTGPEEFQILELAYSRNVR